jgi:type VI secretion system protein ImpF
MPRGGDEFRTVSSFLDRLIEEPDTNVAERSSSLRGLKRAVARDLEALFNTRREALDEVPTDFQHASQSLLTYGLPDFSALDFGNQTDRNHVRRSLEQAITTFEPRLDRVHVAVEPPRPFDRGLRFHIEAVLRVEPTPEPVVFDALLQLATQECHIEGRG